MKGKAVTFDIQGLRSTDLTGGFCDRESDYFVYVRKFHRTSMSSLSKVNQSRFNILVRLHYLGRVSFTNG